MLVDGEEGGKQHWQSKSEYPEQNIIFNRTPLAMCEEVFS